MSILLGGRIVRRNGLGQAGNPATVGYGAAGASAWRPYERPLK